MELIPDGIPDYARALIPQSQLRSDMRSYGLSSSQQRTIMELPWVADGVSGYELGASAEILALADRAPSLLPMVIELPWVQDGLNEHEDRALNRVSWAVFDNPEAAIDAIFDMPWARNDLDFHESTAIISLSKIAIYQPESIVRAILEMPFLQTVEPVDALALAGLQGWSARSERFRRIMNHPIVVDGITDEESGSVALLLGSVFYDPGTDAELLRADAVGIEERVIQRQSSADVTIRVVRQLPGSPCTMDSLEEIVHMLEEFMSLPLPLTEINFVFVSDQVRGPFINTNKFVFAKQEYPNKNAESLADCLEDEQYRRLDGIYAHEAMHYYCGWGDGPAWLCEGVADFFQDIRYNANRGSPIMPNKANDCTEYLNISELEGGETRQVHSCDYTLGRFMFHDLYRHMDELTFRQSFRHLHLLIDFDDPGDECAGSGYANICHVREAFTKFVPSSEKAAIEDIIDKWYLGDYPRYWTGDVPKPWVHGVLLGTDGEPLQGIEVGIEGGDRQVWFGRTHRDGKFDSVARPSSTKLNLYVKPPSGCALDRLWFDGNGLSSHRRDAADLIVDGITTFDPITITLPISSEDIRCGAKAIRGVFIGDLSEFTWIYVQPLQNGQQLDWTAREDGTFETWVPDGSRTQIRVWADTRVTDEHIFLGWLGEDGLVQRRTDAKTFETDGQDIEGIVITLPEP